MRLRLFWDRGLELVRGPGMREGGGGVLSLLLRVFYALVGFGAWVFLCWALMCGGMDGKGREGEGRKWDGMDGEVLGIMG